MNEKGFLSGFLTSKFMVAFACFLLIGSITASYLRLNDDAQSRKLRHVVNTLAVSLREAETTPGDVQIIRKLPTVGKSYTILIRGKSLEHQMVKIRIQSEEGLQKTIFLGCQVNDGDFFIERKNPSEIKLGKSDHISMEIN